MIQAVVLKRYECRSFREFVMGEDPFPKKNAKPFKCLNYGYPCICRERFPYSHWIVPILMKKTPGWVIDDE
jgi:hypothetical protein